MKQKKSEEQNGEQLNDEKTSTIAKVGNHQSSSSDALHVSSAIQNSESNETTDRFKKEDIFKESFLRVCFFDLLDHNKDGTLSLIEFLKLQAFNKNNAFFYQLDKDKNGQIEFNEFIIGIQAMRRTSDLVNQLELWRNQLNIKNEADQVEIFRQKQGIKRGSIKVGKPSSISQEQDFKNASAPSIDSSPEINTMSTNGKIGDLDDIADTNVII